MLELCVGTPVAALASLGYCGCMGKRILSYAMPQRARDGRGAFVSNTKLALNGVSLIAGIAFLWWSHDLRNESTFFAMPLGAMVFAGQAMVALPMIGSLIRTFAHWRDTGLWVGLGLAVSGPLLTAVGLRAL